MDFKNSIVLTSNETNIKFCLPIDSVVNIFQGPTRLYGANQNGIVTHISISMDNYRALGLSVLSNSYHRSPSLEGHMHIEVIDDFKIVWALLKGDKGAKVLYEE